MNERILLVEDEQELCLTLCDRLRSASYIIETASDGDSGLQKATQFSFDLFILDVLLPGRSGLEVCSAIRHCGITTPILILSALGQIPDKIAGLRLGADDYLTKPFDTLELMARIEALLRRKTTHKSAMAPNLFRFGAIEVDIRNGRVLSNGEVVNLTATEFHLLRYFLDHPGVIITRDELLQNVWSHKGATVTRTVDMHIANLRQKLESSPKYPELIITVQGIGYRFELKPPSPKCGLLPVASSSDLVECPDHSDCPPSQLGLFG